MHLVTLWIKGILVRKKKRKEKCHRKLNICFHSNLSFSLRFVKDSETHHSLHLVWYFRLVIGGYWQTRKERQLGGLKHKHLCHWHFLSLTKKTKNAKMKQKGVKVKNSSQKILLANCQPTVDWHLANSWPTLFSLLTVSNVSVTCWPTVDRQVTDSQKWKPLFTITQKGSPQDFLHLCKVYVISRMTQFHGI